MGGRLERHRIGCSVNGSFMTASVWRLLDESEINCHNHAEISFFAQESMATKGVMVMVKQQKSWMPKPAKISKTAIPDTVKSDSE